MGLVDSIIGAESGGNATATNPNSSATGAGQFLSSTWLDMLAKHRPDLTGSPEELLALRNDPQLSRQMTEAYANQNGEILSKAGLPVTPGSTYLAHFAGPQGAVKILQSDPNAPVSDILGAAAVKANPFLQGMTAQGLQAWAAKKMGVSAPQAGTQSETPPAPANGLVAPPQSAPIFAPPQQQAAPQQQQQAQPAPEPAFELPPQPPPIFAPPRRQIDLSKLQAALGNRGFYFGKRA